MRQGTRRGGSIRRAAVTEQMPFGTAFGDYEAYHALIPRDKRWAKESQKHLAENRKCVCCGQPSEVVHHVIPVSKNRLLEMVRSNWAAMCHRCHFSVGHLNWWANFNRMFWECVRLLEESQRRQTTENAMPVPDLPDTVPECQKRIRELELENTELRVRAEQTVGGFLDRNGKSIIAILLAVATALGLTNLGANLVNHERISEARDTQQEIKKTTEQVAERTNEVGSGVDDIKREVKKKKGPFGE